MICNCSTFVAGSYGSLIVGSLPEIAQCDIYKTSLNVLLLSKDLNFILNL